MSDEYYVYYIEKPDVFYKTKGSIPKSGHAVIEASAGTGKTYTISKLFLDFIYNGIPAEKCLFITFTCKATEEMQERLRSELETLVYSFNIDVKIKKGIAEILECLRTEVQSLSLCCNEDLAIKKAIAEMQEHILSDLNNSILCCCEPNKNEKIFTQMQEDLSRDVEILVLRFYDELKDRQLSETMQERLRCELESLVLRFIEDATVKREGLLLNEDRPNVDSEQELIDKYWVLDFEHQKRIRKAADEFSKVTICTIDSLTHRMLRECGDMTTLSACTQVSNTPPEDEAFERFLRLDVMDDPILRAIAVAYDKYDKYESDAVESESFNSQNVKYFKETLLTAYKTGAKDTVKLEELLKNAEFSGSIETYRQTCMELLDAVKSEFSDCTEISQFKAKLKSLNYNAFEKDVVFYNYIQIFSLNGKRFEQDVWLKLTALTDKLQVGAKKAGYEQIEKLKSYALPESFFLAKYALPKFSIRMTEAKEEVGIFEHKDFTKQLATDIRKNERLKAKFRELWQIAVVDEFQDTSAEQWTIFKNAFIGDNEGTETGARLFIVGDPKQAIYGFRGGDVKMYNKAVKHVENPPATLDRNFRASSSVIEGCNAIFSAIIRDLKNSSKAALCSEFQFTPVNAAHEDWALYDLNNDTALTPIVAGVFSAEQISSEIEYLLSSAAIEKGSGNQKKIRKIYILGRNGSDFNDVRIALNMRGIDYVDSSSTTPEELFDLPEIKALATVMRAILEPYHNGRLAAALNSILFGLDLDVIRNLDSVVPLIESCYGEKFKYWHELTLKPFSAGIIFEDLLRFCNFAERLSLLSESVMPYERVRGVVDYLTSLSVSEKLSWEGLIARISAIRKGEVKLNEDDIVISHTDARVQLMTVHKSKGLEADVVFVLPFKKSNVNPNRFKLLHVNSAEHDIDNDNNNENGEVRCIPDNLSSYVPMSGADQQAKNEQEAEVIRLLYVALTRASMRLYICRPAKKANQSTKDPSIEEQFYKTLDKLVDECGFDTKCGRETLDQVSSEYIQNKVINTLAPQSEIIKTIEGNSPDETRRVRNVVSYTAVSKTLDSEGDSDVWQSQRNVASKSRWNIEKGKNTGLFLHKMFEIIDFSSLTESENGSLVPYNKWSTDANVAKQFARWGNHFSIRRSELETARELVYATLARPLTPYSLPEDVSLPSRFCDISTRDKVCELDFVCRACDVANSPIIDEFFEDSEEFRQQLEDQVHDSTLIRGTFDMLFKVQKSEETLVYLVDWKSDSLDGYDELSMHNYVKEHFTIQAAFYSYAIQNELKRLNKSLAKPHRYAGMLYVFLRGISKEDGVRDGLYFIPAMYNEFD